MTGVSCCVGRPGQLRHGGPITGAPRAGKGVTVAKVFRARTLGPELLSSILAAGELPEETRELARAGRTLSLG